jgi:membrane protease YdiL (CAAX protease family)
METHAATQPAPWRLVAWLAFVLGLTAIGYASNLAGGDPPDDIAYRWASSIGALIQYGLMFGILLLIGHGLDRRAFFALRAPRSWPRAAGYIVLGFVAINLVSWAYIQASGADPSDEQGLVPDGWDPDRAPQFIAFFITVVVVAPFVEELIYRGVGYSVLAPYGAWVAIIATGVLFGASHGLLEALPILAAFGILLAWLRARTDSVYPGMLLHAVFNGVALIVAVTGNA